MKDKQDLLKQLLMLQRPSTDPVGALELGYTTLNKNIDDTLNKKAVSEWVRSHDKTLPDGRKLDVIKLWEVSKDIKPEKVFLDDIKGPSKSKKSGFRKIRYANADVSFPLLTDKKNFLLDGRHRYFKLKDSDHDTGMVKKVTAKMINECIFKQAMKTERKQIPTTDQVSRHPSAVIIQGNPDYVRGNHAAQRFYADIADLIRKKGYTVTRTKGEASGKPPGANVWISHGGHNPPKGTKVLNIPQYPRPFMTKELIAALDRVTTRK